MLHVQASLFSFYPKTVCLAVSFWWFGGCVEDSCLLGYDDDHDDDGDDDNDDDDDSDDD